MPTGVLFSTGTRCVQVANGSDGSVRAYSAATLAQVVRLTGLDDADNMRFDPGARQVYVGYGDGALAVVDSALSRVLATISLPGHPESFQLERSGKRIFVNVPAAREVTVVDRELRLAVGHWALAGFGGNFPMALDEASHRLFVGCRNLPRLAVLNTATGALISGDTDDLFYDSARRCLYISCGEGFLDTVHWDGGDQYRRIARQPTRAGARTSYFASSLDEIFLAVPKRNGADAEIRVYRPPTGKAR